MHLFVGTVKIINLKYKIWKKVIGNCQQMIEKRLPQEYKNGDSLLPLAVVKIVHHFTFKVVSFRFLTSLVEKLKSLR